MPKMPDFSQPLTASEALRTRCLHTIINTRTVKGKDERSCLLCGVIFEGDAVRPQAMILNPLEIEDMPAYDMRFIDPKGLKLANEMMDEIRQRPLEEMTREKPSSSQLANKKRRANIRKAR